MVSESLPCLPSFRLERLQRAYLMRAVSCPVRGGTAEGKKRGCERINCGTATDCVRRTAPLAVFSSDLTLGDSIVLLIACQYVTRGSLACLASSRLILIQRSHLLRVDLFIHYDCAPTLMRWLLNLNTLFSNKKIYEFEISSCVRFFFPQQKWGRIMVMEFARARPHLQLVVHG